MSGLRFSFREGVSSLWRRRTSSALAMTAIALAALVLSSLLLVTSNLERVLSGWSSAAEFSVYLTDTASSDQRGAVEAAVDASGIAERREYVSKVDALARFKRDYAELEALAAALQSNPFPASVEVQVRTERQGSAEVEALVEALATLPGVADVRYDREWIRRVTGGLAMVRRLGLLIGLIMTAAAALTVAAVIRLAFDARREEIRLMYLVGAPYRFIRGPFVVEGLVLGGLGAAVAVLVLWLGYRAAFAWWTPTLSSLGALDALRFLPAQMAAFVVLGGAVVGSACGFAVSRRTT
ncbi:MAG: cell division protein FtsX [Vicinamibacterales bacterium]